MPLSTDGVYEYVRLGVRALQLVTVYLQERSAVAFEVICCSCTIRARHGVFEPPGVACAGVDPFHDHWFLSEIVIVRS